MQAALCTIGYEGSEIGSFVPALVTAGVSLVVDIRDVAHSRKPGFSKGSLRQHIVAAGLDYLHLRDLGDPKPGREAARGVRPLPGGFPRAPSYRQGKSGAIVGRGPA